MMVVHALAPRSATAILARAGKLANGRKARRQRRWFSLRGQSALPKAACAFVLAVATLVPESAFSQACPRERWERLERAPGWSRQRLRAADAVARSNGVTSYVVVADGRLVWSFGAATEPVNVRSVRKSIVSMLYGIAKDRGAVDISRTLADLEIDDVDRLSDVEKTATVRHLLSARSCVYHLPAFETQEQEDRRPPRHSCKPGSQWYYNNWDFNALGTIYQKLTGETIFDAFEAQIAKPLQLENFHTPSHTRFHLTSTSLHPAYLFRLSALDMARIGLLMARGGDWCGRRVISQGWVSESTSAISKTGPNTGYGYMWWVGADGEQFGVKFNGPTFTARGFGGQYILVNPADDLVIVQTAQLGPARDPAFSRKFGDLLKAIMAARE